MSAPSNPFSVFRFLRLPAILLGLGILFSPSAAHAQRLGVSADLSLAQTIFLPDEDMDLKVHIINRSGQTLALGDSDDWLTLSIQGADNFSALKLGDMSLASPFTLGSGMMATRTFNPAPYYDVRRPGRYTINATIRIPQWKQTVTCKPVSFTVIEGIPLPGLGALEFGMPAPAGVTNATPEIRRYGLIKVAYLDELKLYFRLTDGNGKTLRCCPAGQMLSFSDPEAQLDHFNNLHVLWQTGAKEFTYLVFMPDGNLLVRETHLYTETRPTLQANDHGNIVVSGGVRRYSAQDLPAPTHESARQ